MSLGCESFDRYRLEHAWPKASGPAGQGLVIQNDGGTRPTHRGGAAWVAEQAAGAGRSADRADGMSELIVGTVCGGSDGTSGITGNPAAGIAFDKLVAAGAACIFEETGELIGCEAIMAARAATPGPGRRTARLRSKRPRAITQRWAMAALPPAMPMAG